MRGTWHHLAAGVVGTILSVLPTAMGQGAEAGGASASNSILEFQVVGRQNKEPIAGVELKIRIDSQTREDVTNEQGRCRIEYAPKLNYLSVRASKQGLTPMQVAWRMAESPTKIPGEYTLAMEPGTIIGGIIRDEDGKPIEGATVSLLVPSDNGGIERVSIWDHPEKTDAEGRWRCDFMPAKLDDIWIRLAHPDYISDEMYGKTPAPPIESLRSQTGVMVMKRGVTVAGRVVDMDGKPIEGATVAQGSDRFGSHYPDTTTDKDGRFEFKNVRPEQMVLTVQARGFAPELEQPLPQKGMAPIEFKLERGHTLRGRIVDKAGNPVAGAFVSADTWRGHRSLEWRVDTDAEGRFRWEEAPSDEVQIDMGKEHYMSVRNNRMTASDQEYTITMLPMLRIKGRVTDKETGQPISKFTVSPGIDWGDGRPVYWERRDMKPFTDGQYEITFGEPRPGHYFRVEAEGYLPAVSRSFDDAEGEVTFDLQMKKGAGVSGTVRFADGQPVAEADVFLCTPSQGIFIRNGRSEQSRESIFVRTGQDGRFSFPAQEDAYRLVVLHDKGCAEVAEGDLAKSSDVTLQAWGRVEGKALIGVKPGAEKEIRALFDRPYDRSAPRVQFDCAAVADKEGHFVMERVPPGKVRICRMIGGLFSHDVPIEVKAGETANVTIGGVGRPVVGKVAMADEVRDQIDWKTGERYARSQSDEGSYRSLGMEVEKDGSFRIDDVPAGNYTLYFMAFKPPTAARTYRGELIGRLSHSFTVAPMAGGRSDEPLDLGAVDLIVTGGAPAGPLLVGKALPDLKDLQLGAAAEELNGKRLVLCFFDMNQRPSRNAVIQLAKQSETLKARGIMSVAVAAQGQKADDPAFKEWTRQNAVGLVVGVAADEGNKLRSAWGVRSLPWLILTDAQHVVRAEGFGVDELDSRIQGEKL
jgi:protocatechuate 3,4-dioxygenase beta subunit